MNHLASYKPDFALLLEGGFVAINQGDADAATKLFQSCEILKPENPTPKIGLGFLHFNQLNFKAASHFFESALKMEPQNMTAKVLLGFCMALSKEEAKGEKILEETVKSSDASIKNLSSSILSFIQQFIQSQPSPMDIHKKEKKERKQKK